MELHSPKHPTRFWYMYICWLFPLNTNPFYFSICEWNSVRHALNILCISQKCWAVLKVCTYKTCVAHTKYTTILGVAYWKCSIYLSVYAFMLLCHLQLIATQNRYGKFHRKKIPHPIYVFVRVRVRVRMRVVWVFVCLCVCLDRILLKWAQNVHIYLVLICKWLKLYDDVDEAKTIKYEGRWTKEMGSVRFKRLNGETWRGWCRCAGESTGI